MFDLHAQHAVGQPISQDSSTVSGSKRVYMHYDIKLLMPWVTKFDNSYMYYSQN